MCESRDSYQRRRPDETRLYQLIEEHWPTFLERAEQAGGLPDFRASACLASEWGLRGVLAIP